MSAAIANDRRIEVILENPNSIFVGWVEQWLKDAEKKNLKSVPKLKIALQALKSFPLPLASGRECGILRGFGPSLCNLIDKKLEEFKRNNLEEFNKSIQYTSDVKLIAKKYSRKRELAVRNQKSNEKIQKNKNVTPTQEAEQIIMSPGEFEILLIVDTQETNGKKKSAKNDETRSHLDAHKVSYEVRHLEIGDFLWVARNVNEKELVLPYIVERKRMDDFASSIRDGRFHEQKYRLRDCGITNLIYLIENFGNNQNLGLPITTLMQAATNTQIHSNFQIKFTDNHHDTILYLSVLSNILKDLFKDKVLIGTPKSCLVDADIKSSVVGLMTFDEFQKNSVKNKPACVKEVFIKQLLQLKTLSIDKAIAITEVYPTPRALQLAYKSCSSQEEGENLLCKIPSGKLGRPVGSYISKVLYQFYNTNFA